ncbi:MAG: VanZ family protein [Acidimicrobiales bacterium]|nr:VanZ family protein [Acidimicrobiales bacterium]
MDPWAWPAYIGVVWGLVLFVLALVPILVIQYRLYGDMNGRRLAGACGLSIYVVALAAYTLLPAPNRSQAWCDAHGGGHGWQVVPFSTFADAFDATRGLGVRATLLDRHWLEIVFNVALFVPLGIWCRRFFERSVAAATGIGLAVSLLIETTQGTANWGLWPCPYRYASVDDLMTNTLGSFLGATVGWVFLSWMPQSSRLERARLTPRPVTVFRRWMGMVLDAGIVATGGLATAMAVRIFVIATGHRPPATPLPAEAVIAYAVPLALFVYVPALIGEGASVGQRLVWLAPRWRVAATVRRRLLRATVSPGVAVALALVGAIGPYRLRTLASLSAWAIVLVSLLATLVTEGHRGLSGVIAGADIVDSRVGTAEESTTTDESSAAVSP